jgi:phosphinothricin acetyltransferase
VSHETEIRPARPEDAPEVARIWKEGVLASSGQSAPPAAEVCAAFLDRIQRPVGKSGLWVATCGSEIVGWQGLHDFGLTQISRIAQSSTYISAQWHGKLIGRGLLQYAQDRARERGFNCIVGWIKTDNSSSIRLVQSLGWKQIGILPRASEADAELAYWAYAVPKSGNPPAEEVSHVKTNFS